MPILQILIHFTITGLVSNSKLTGSDCLIHNKQYSYEYLYSSSSNDTKNVYLLPLAKVDNFNYLRWSIDPVPGNSEQFYLRSSHFGTRLCAVNNMMKDVFFSRGSKKNVGIIISSSSDYIQNCKWIIKRTDANSNKTTAYFMDNVFYGDSLYPTMTSFMSILKQNENKRKIILWNRNKSSLKSNKFKWFIDCNKGNYLWI